MPSWLGKAWKSLRDRLSGAAAGRAWQEAAERCGVRDLRWSGRCLQGIYGRGTGYVDVTIAADRSIAAAGVLEHFGRTRRRGQDELWLAVAGLAPFAVFVRAGGEEGCPTGDPLFDRDFRVEGAADVVAAVLDEPARDAVRALFFATGSTFSLAAAPAFVDPRLAGGVVSAGAPLEGQDAGWLSELLAQLLRTAEHLVSPLDVAQALAANAREERLEGVRRVALLALTHQHAGHALTRAAQRAALDDPAESVRLEAALLLGAEAEAVLHALAGGASDDVVANRALEALDPLPPDELLALLQKQRAAGHPRAALACIAQLRGGGGASAVEALGTLLAQEGEELAEAAAQALGYAGLPGAERVLLAAGLAHPAAGVRVAAARALGAVGTAAAVPPLHEAARSASAVLEHAAARAVREIQARLVGAAPGQLSVASDADGAVSLSEPGGQLSFPDPKRR